MQLRDVSRLQRLRFICTLTWAFGPGCYVTGRWPLLRTLSQEQIRPCCAPYRRCNSPLLRTVRQEQICCRRLLPCRTEAVARMLLWYTCRVGQRVEQARPAVAPTLQQHLGEWLSLVEHLVRDQGVGGSNPLSPTNYLEERRPAGRRSCLPIRPRICSPSQMKRPGRTMRSSGCSDCAG